ncbi:unnamed protein product [Fusarium graminearum]|nr:unnamed protein product [Fusarium graminearum]
MHRILCPLDSAALGAQSPIPGPGDWGIDGVMSFSRPSSDALNLRRFSSESQAQVQDHGPTYRAQGLTQRSSPLFPFAKSSPPRLVSVDARN